MLGAVFDLMSAPGSPCVLAGVKPSKITKDTYIHPGLHLPLLTNIQPLVQTVTRVDLSHQRLIYHTFIHLLHSSQLHTFNIPPLSSFLKYNLDYYSLFGTYSQIFIISCLSYIRLSSIFIYSFISLYLIYSNISGNKEMIVKINKDQG